MLRGAQRKCPACGQSHAFAGYLKLADRCNACGTKLGQIRADDFPPYVTILIVGHIVVPLVLLAEQLFRLDLTIQLAIWPAATVLLTLLLLPAVKGAIVGLMWSLKLRGDEVQGEPEAFLPERDA